MRTELFKHLDRLLRNVGGLFLCRKLKGKIKMTKPKEKTREERRERNHRIFLYDSFVDSTAPEVRGMTEVMPYLKTILLSYEHPPLSVRLFLFY